MKNGKSLLIWDSPEQAPDGDDYKILWQGYSATCLNKEVLFYKQIFVGVQMTARIFHSLYQTTHY